LTNWRQVLTGAAAALGGTGGMVAYGVTKAATHQLIKSLVDDFAKQGRTVLGLLPVTLDTPSNRSGMPNADFSSWTPLSFVARQVLEWSGADRKPASGSLHKIVTEKNVSRLEEVHQ
jgi:dihydropteridine reductase